MKCSESLATVRAVCTPDAVTIDPNSAVTCTSYRLRKILSHTCKVINTEYYLVMYMYALLPPHSPTHTVGRTDV